MTEDVSLIKAATSMDAHVGARVRLRRLVLGLSQERLAGLVGVTFQQVQNYELGANRISASRLQQIAAALNITPAYFFEDASGADASGAAGIEQRGFAEDGGPDGAGAEGFATAEGLPLMRAFMRLRDPILRAKIVQLVRALAEAEKD